jgi:ADP-heptose:LPS heptosyltransferase
VILFFQNFLIIKVKINLFGKNKFMINKYLIFRTDRIGDFLITAILIKSIKRNDPNSHIQIISSKKNHTYIKSFKMVDEVVLLNKSFIGKLKLIIKLQKSFYKTIIVHDSKKRSKIISFFLKKDLLIISNINQSLSYFNDIKKILKFLNFTFNDSDLNTLNERDKVIKKDIKSIDKYIIFHFDEKWIYDQYISRYVNIEPTYNEFCSLLNSIISKTNKNVVITTGLYAPEILNKMKNNKLNPKILFYNNINFFDIEDIIEKSDCLISCHGAVSHVAAAMNVKQIDIIDKTYNYSKWTEHFRNYNSLNRKPFNELSDNIIELL